ncbi:hypothetical protein [Actinokineospora cianjurensis]|uniref:Uncharacterized protein n=1 Tax=Actinokineospora cianjurensis TaxID=585224 RepID=A0A421B162_9PSEU|nr:hypothetical protein [Actinokineospora cianjurensis]RLK58021.1 hypothetical protein CLV68_4112 [Actinokineospora cianjurensis]
MGYIEACAQALSCFTDPIRVRPGRQGLAMGFEVLPENVLAAGNRGKDIMGGLRGADSGAPVLDVAAAMPGSGTAVTSHSFAGTWTRKFTDWCGVADAHVTALEAAARAYLAADRKAEGAIIGSGTPRPR